MSASPASRRRIMVATFLESFASVCVERGVFFYAHRHLAFTERGTLWLALTFGAAYVAGSLGCHPLCRRWNEKNVLVAALAGLALVHAVLALTSRSPVPLFAGNLLCGLLTGAKWPIIESYMTSGGDTRRQVDLTGRFNLCWAGAVPLAVAACGPLNVTWPAGLFMIPCAQNLVSLVLIRGLAERPEHAGPTTGRGADDRLRASFRHLLAASRWLLFLTYASMWVITALSPLILARLAVPDGWAPAVSSVMDAMRLTAFIVLQWATAWVGRRFFPVWTLAGLGGGFLLVVTGWSPLLFVAGNLVFGLAAGSAYVAAFYYAVAVKNASVDAGGSHEGLIGAGFSMGPAVCLLGLALAPVAGGRVMATVAGMLPLMVLCAAGVVRHVRRHAPPATVEG